MDKNIPERVSCIVIGGGITGLSTAITWAKNNPSDEKPVLLLEKEPGLGGYVTSFKRKDYLFDTVQLIPDSFAVLKYFGIDIDLKQFEGYYARIFLTDTTTGKVKCIAIPSGVEAFRTFLLQNYPNDEKAINKYFIYAQKMFDELFHLKVEPTFFEILNILFKCPKIITQSSKTFRQFLKRFHFSEPEISEIFDVFAAFSGLPSERVAALLPVSAMTVSLQGSYRPYKGFIEFPHKMKVRLKELGGHILTNTTVEKILIENNRAIGVQCENGKRFYADYVVTTIDPKVGMQKLVGKELLQKQSPSYARKVDTAKMSASAFMINLGLDEEIDLEALGFNCGYNLLTTGKGIFNKLYKTYEKGDRFMSKDEFFIPVICPSLPLGKKNALTMFVYPASVGDWCTLRDNDYAAYTKKKTEIAQHFIGLVEQYMIPGLCKHIQVMDIATPATFVRYSGSPTGSKFDMAPYPTNFGKNRLKMRTPIKNLFQPKFSHGIWPCLQAGIQVVDMIMDRKIMGGNSRYG